MIDKQALALLAGAFPQFKDQQMQVYGIMLNDIPGAVQLEAVKNLLKTSRFLPTIAEIREEASKLAHAAAGVRVAPAEAEWEEVYKAIGAVGPYRKPAFSNPITAQAVKAMGWRLLCGSDEVMMPALRAQFLKTWKELNAMTKTKRRMERSMNGGLKQLTRETLQRLQGEKMKQLELGKGEKDDTRRTDGSS